MSLDEILRLHHRSVSQDTIWTWRYTDPRPWHMSPILEQYFRVRYPPEQQETVLHIVQMVLIDRYKVPYMFGMAVFAATTAIVLGVALINAMGSAMRRSATGRRWINHLLEAPLGAKYRATACRWGVLVLRLPGRLHAILLILLWALNIAALFVLPAKFPDTAWSEYSDALGKPQLYRLRTTADRLAVLTLTQLPLVFLFAGRNAIPLRMAQCSFNTLMLYHRHLARIVTLDACFHAMLYWEYARRKNHLRQWEHETYIAAGYHALYMFILISILSYTPIRQWAYEIFLVLHLVLVAGSLCLVYFHIPPHIRLPYALFIYLCLGWWAVDRLIRGTKLALLNVRLHPRSPARTSRLPLLRRWVSWASASPLPDGTTLVRIYPMGYQAASLAHTEAGHHIYLTLPWLELSSHPFTILARGGEGDQVYLDLVIAPVKGFSHKLARTVRRKTQKGGPYEAIALLEGPYGHPVDLNYRTMALFASGVGIAHTQAVLLQSLSDGRWERGQNIHFVWVIKDQTSLQVLLSYLTSALMTTQRRGTRGSLDLRIFCTRVPCPPRASQTGHASDPPAPRTLGTTTALDPVQHCGPSELSSDEERALLEADDVTFLEHIRAAGVTARLHAGGRPDVHAEMEMACSMAPGTQGDAEADGAAGAAAGLNTINEPAQTEYGTFPGPQESLPLHAADPADDSEKTGPILVSSCGGPEFSDQVRLAVRRVRSRHPHVDLHEEVFAW